VKLRRAHAARVVFRLHYAPRFPSTLIDKLRVRNRNFQSDPGYLHHRSSAKKSLEFYQHLSLKSVDKAYQDSVQSVGI